MLYKNQNNPLFSKLMEDQQQLEENINLSKTQSLLVHSKFSRRATYYKNKRLFWLMAAIILSSVATYPVIEPLLNQAFSEGNLFALSLICLFTAAILSIFVTEKLNK